MGPLINYSVQFNSSIRTYSINSIHVSNIYVYIRIRIYTLLEERDNIWFGYPRLSSAEHYCHNWLLTDEWTDWTQRAALAIDIHVCYKGVQWMHLRPILKGLHGLCFKRLNRYNTLFAANERGRHLHTSDSTCSTPEASVSTHGVAHAAGKEDCPQPSPPPVPVCQWAMRCIAGLWTEKESLGLCKVDFSHSWSCACRFYHLCSPAALTLMNDTCMGPSSSIKTGELTVYRAISIKLSYSAKQGGHTHSPWPLLNPQLCQGIVSGSAWWPRPKACQRPLWQLKFQCSGTV